MKSILATDRHRRLFTVAALAVAYYLAARLGLLLAFAANNASPVWPPSGIALASVKQGQGHPLSSGALAEG